MKEDLFVFILEDKTGWQKRIFYRTKDRQALGQLAKAVASWQDEGKKNHDLLLLTQKKSRDLGLEEVPH